MAVKNSAQNKQCDLTTTCSLVREQYTDSTFMVCADGNYIPRNKNIWPTITFRLTPTSFKDIFQQPRLCCYELQEEIQLKNWKHFENWSPLGLYPGLLLQGLVSHKQNAGEEVSEPTIEPRKTALRHKMLTTTFYTSGSYSLFLFKSVIILSHVCRVLRLINMRV
jgi:hypothetical protein